MAEIVAEATSTRATKIAQSDGWTALARVASVAGMAVLVPIASWVGYQEWQNSVALSAHTQTIESIKSDVGDIKKQDGQDHDWVVTLRTQVDSLMIQVQKLWDRPAKNDKPPP